MKRYEVKELYYLKISKKEMVLKKYLKIKNNKIKFLSLLNIFTN
jgi:hypothetical protein